VREGNCSLQDGAAGTQRVLPWDWSEVSQQLIGQARQTDMGTIVAVTHYRPPDQKEVDEPSSNNWKKPHIHSPGLHGGL